METELAKIMAGKHLKAKLFLPDVPEDKREERGRITINATSEGDSNDEVQAEISVKLTSIKPFWSCYYVDQPYVTIERFLEVPKATIDQWYDKNEIDKPDPDEDDKGADDGTGKKKAKNVWKDLIKEEMTHLLIPEGEVPSITVWRSDTAFNELETTY